MNVYHEMMTSKPFAIDSAIQLADSNSRDEQPFVHKKASFSFVFKKIIEFQRTLVSLT